MKLSTIKTALTSKVGRQLLQVQKHSPVLLFGAGVVGVVGAAVLASRATLKLNDVLADAQEDLYKARHLEHIRYSEEDRRRDIIIIYSRTAAKVARLYAPAIGVGALAIAALTGSHFILSRRNAAITAAYAALDKGFREYRRRVADEFGPEKERELRSGKIEGPIEESPHGLVIRTKGDCTAEMSIYARLFDEFSTSWSPDPGYNRTFLSCQQNYANDLLTARGHLFLNEVYDMLGLPRSKEGAVVGWLNDGNGDNYVDFGIFRGNTHDGVRFVLGHDDSVWLDFNVDGIIYDQI